MGLEADISGRAMIFKTPLLALEVPGAFHVIHDFFEFLTVPLLHTKSITLTQLRGQSPFIAEKIPMQNQYFGLG